MPSQAARHSARNVSHIRTGWFLVALFAASLLIVAAVNLVARGIPISTASAGGILGGAVTLMGLPALVAIPWRMIQDRRQRYSNAPIVVASVVFVLANFWFLLGAGLSTR